MIRICVLHVTEMLRILQISSRSGVHFIRSLNRFLELKLNYLNLFQCYEVCSHPECMNYKKITFQLKSVQIFHQESPWLRFDKL